MKRNVSQQSETFFVRNRRATEMPCLFTWPSLIFNDDFKAAIELERHTTVVSAVIDFCVPLFDWFWTDSILPRAAHAQMCVSYLFIYWACGHTWPSTSYVTCVCFDGFDWSTAIRLIGLGLGHSMLGIGLVMVTARDYLITNICTMYCQRNSVAHSVLFRELAILNSFWSQRIFCSASVKRMHAAIKLYNEFVIVAAAWYSEPRITLTDVKPFQWITLIQC